jgi:hypothetical protein
VEPKISPADWAGAIGMAIRLAHMLSSLEFSSLQVHAGEFHVPNPACALLNKNPGDEAHTGNLNIARLCPVQSRI